MKCGSGPRKSPLVRVDSRHKIEIYYLSRLATVIKFNYDVEAPVESSLEFRSNLDRFYDQRTMHNIIQALQIQNVNVICYCSVAGIICICTYYTHIYIYCINVRRIESVSKCDEILYTALLDSAEVYITV